MHFRTETLGHRCLWLTAAIGAVWLLSLLPAQHFFGVAGIEAAAVSAACCLAGGCFTFWLAACASRPKYQAFAVLFGTAIRGIAALIGMAVMQFVLELKQENYLAWLGLFYLVSLALETFLLTRPREGGRGVDRPDSVPAG
jgi:hypothetical protein